MRHAPELDMNQAELLDLWQDIQLERVANDPDWQLLIKDHKRLVLGDPINQQRRGELKDRYDIGLSTDNIDAPWNRIAQITLEARIHEGLRTEYACTEMAIRLGLAWNTEIDLRQERILAEKPFPWLIDLYESWYRLGVESNHISRDKHAENWHQAIQLVDEPYKRVMLMAHYLEEVRPTESKRILTDLLDPGNIVPLAYLATFLPEPRGQDKDIAISLANSLKPKSDLLVYFNSLISLCNAGLNLGLTELIEPTHQYLLQAAEQLDAGEVDALMMSSLLRYYATSKIPSERKAARAHRLSTEIKRQPNSVDRGTLTEAQIILILASGDFDLALETSQTVESHNFNHILIDLVAEGGRRGKLDKVRLVQDSWLKNMSHQGGKSKDKQEFYYHFRSRLLPSWLYAAQLLTYEGINLTNEPEVLEAIKSDRSISLDVGLIDLYFQGMDITSLVPAIWKRITDYLTGDWWDDERKHKMYYPQYKDYIKALMIMRKH